MWRGGGIAAVLAGALAVSGCGAAEQGGTGKGDANERPATAAAGQADSAAGQSEIQVNRSYWYAGFKVTLGTARLSSAKSGSDKAPVVTIDATFQNLSPDQRPPSRAENCC